MSIIKGIYLFFIIIFWGNFVLPVQKEKLKQRHKKYVP